MLVVKTILIFIVSLIIDLIKVIYVPLIKKHRYVARVYVYNYFLYSKKDIVYLPLMVRVGDVVISDGRHYLPYIDATKNKVRIFIYYWFVWIWLDDTCSCDIVSLERLVGYYYYKKDDNSLSEIRSLAYHTTDTVFDRPVQKMRDINLKHLVKDLCLSDNSNFRNRYRYSKKKKSFIGIGYRNSTYDNTYGEIYEIELWGLTL